jgi:hypothetical protein
MGDKSLDILDFGAPYSWTNPAFVTQIKVPEKGSCRPETMMDKRRP